MGEGQGEGALSAAPNSVEGQEATPTPALPLKGEGELKDAMLRDPAVGGIALRGTIIFHTDRRIPLGLLESCSRIKSGTGFAVVTGSGNCLWPSEATHGDGNYRHT